MCVCVCQRLGRLKVFLCVWLCTYSIMCLFVTMGRKLRPSRVWVLHVKLYKCVCEESGGGRSAADASLTLWLSCGADCRDNSHTTLGSPPVSCHWFADLLARFPFPFLLPPPPAPPLLLPLSPVQTCHLERQMPSPNCWPAPTATGATSVWHRWRSTSSTAMRRTRRTSPAPCATTRLLTALSLSGIWPHTSLQGIRWGGFTFFFFSSSSSPPFYFSPPPPPPLLSVPYFISNVLWSLREERSFFWLAIIINFSWHFEDADPLMVITLIEALNGFLMALPDMIFQSRVHDRMIVLISNLEIFISSLTSLHSWPLMLFWCSLQSWCSIKPHPSPYF